MHRVRCKSEPDCIKDMLLRHYQQDGIDCLWDYFQSGGTGNPLLCYPTGTGKSIILAGAIAKIISKYRATRILALVHVKELVEQNSAKLKKFFPDVDSGIFSAGLGEDDTDNQVIFGGVASVVKALDKLGVFHIVFVDEAHTISPKDETMYRIIFETLEKRNPGLRVVGLTATPWRTGMGRIDGEGGIFTETICDWTTMERFNQLISEGFLCTLVPYSPKLELDVSDVGTTQGDFDQGQLERAINKDEITIAALQECLAFKEDRKSWLIFGAGVEHCLRIAELLNEMGVSAKAVWSSRKVKVLDEDGLPVKDAKGKYKTKTISCPDKERDETIAQFKRGEFQAIVSNGILTTGFDHPPVDMIVMLRPTKSITLWIQMLGRGTRPYDPYAVDPTEINTYFFNQIKLNTLVLDFARNTKRLGQINDPFIPQKKGKKGGTAPVKECPKCDNNVPASAKICPGILVTTNIPCNYEFPEDPKIETKASEEALIKGDLPEVEIFRVDHISYSSYRNPSKGKAMLASYQCGNRTIREYVCIEYTGAGRGMAERWLKENLIEGYKGVEAVKTVQHMLNNIVKLRTPTHIRVQTNLKYPKILARSWDGSGFGTEAEPTALPRIDTEGDWHETLHQRANNELPRPHNAESIVLEDDDIPF